MAPRGWGEEHRQLDGWRWQAGVKLLAMQHAYYCRFTALPLLLGLLPRRLGLDVPLFNRLLDAGVTSKLLDVQYRMHPAIAAFPSQVGGRLGCAVALVEGGTECRCTSLHIVAGTPIMMSQPGRTLVHPRDCSTSTRGV